MATEEIGDVPDRVSFPENERVMQAYWEKIDAFHTSNKLAEGRPEFCFYDGPPFATGLPHYGHILAGTIKDVVTRYAHQTGHHVVRRFGWDCHGLPVEYEIDQMLGIKMREEVEQMGIDKYNDECRKIVGRYSKEWEVIVNRLGRWIDFDTGYRTMDPTFMESVWWVFGQLYKKDYVYRGFKVMPFSTACATSLSNFEAKSNYKEAKDPEVFITFPLLDRPDTSLVAWTTTPWTLPSNLATCVHPEFIYVVLDVEGKGKFVLLEQLVAPLSKKFKWAKTTVLEKFAGKSMAGWRYKPLFEYFASRAEAGAFRVLVDDYVTSETGSGIVHCAPAFGEDDYRVCMAAGVIVKGQGVICPVDDNGLFTAEVSDYVTRHVKDCDKDIIKRLKSEGRVLLDGTFVHQYPFCWRSDTPLIYKAVPSWFVRVEDVREKLMTHNASTYWVPEFVKEKRFHNWLKEARDWAISRNRFWGTPIPLWVSDDGEEIVCISSRQELAELAGVPVESLSDIHREFIDKLTIPSRQGKGVLRRIPEVFDCWFESGSMPYAQLHYPFENVEYFEKTFPADFIAEGIDQTRGWFYTLLVISTLLFDKPPFKNLIVNGLVLAEDGRKMSKRLKNYPDPLAVVEEHGADALRLYLINSPVVKAENLCFSANGVKHTVKSVMLPWYNAYRFFVQNYRVFAAKNAFVPDFKRVPTNVMDRWVLASTQTLVAFVREEMAAYRLYTVTPRLVTFIEQLTNWYVRLNRSRLKGDAGVDEARAALNTLFEVLMTLVVLMAPFTPFMCEYMYQTFRKIVPVSERCDSVHYLMIPEPRLDAKDADVELMIARMQAVVDCGRLIRERKNIALKMPVRTLIVAHPDPAFLEHVNKMSFYVKEELNVRDIVLTTEDEKYASLKAVPDDKKLGELKALRKPVVEQIAKLSGDQLRQFRQTGKVTVTVLDKPMELDTTQLGVRRVLEKTQAGFEGCVNEQQDVVCLLDITRDEELLAQGVVREFCGCVQQARKAAGLVKQDAIQVFIEDPSGDVQKLIQGQGDTCRATLKVDVLPHSQCTNTNLITKAEFQSALSKSVKCDVYIYRA
eukprot:TRINITY_DN577_c0_g1_i1.p1 TRINITY_DN577_c0_g1~~TRINITY_DN577_c0_g1_i1.p1  ORF type:complete len:1075 (-),score=224.06 TRINITY_DN577_c0_g1_i1:32-3256(-)